MARNSSGYRRRYQALGRFSTRRHYGSKRNPGSSRLLWLSAFIGVLSIAATIAAASTSMAIFRTHTDELVPPEQAISQGSFGPSNVYARDGEFLYQFLDPLIGLHDPVRLEEISQWMIKATISTEDASFYDNPGINIKGLTRAAYENFFPGANEEFLAGSGGSSITQQLVKNVYIPEEERAERSVDRKIKEVAIALELTRQYEKDQILEWYLNQLYYGNFAYGVEAAAQRYFAKSAADLTLAESALLAGIPQAPGFYTPTLPENYEAAMNRQHEVLDLMVEHGDISIEEADAAKAEELVFQGSDFPIRSPHFVFYVRDVLNAMCHRNYLDVPQGTDCENLISRGGLTITTTLDVNLQEQGVAIVQEKISSIESAYNAHNGSLVSIDPKTGEILVMVGSRDYWQEAIDGEVNVAMRDRSPGSTVKVFTYLTALLNGWSAGTALWDVAIPCPPLCNSRGGVVQNWNFSFTGLVNVRQALSQSMNVPAVRTIMDNGVENVIDTAHSMGITSWVDSSLYGPALTIGGGELKLLDLTYAYTVLANNGVMRGAPTVGNLETGEAFPEGYRELDPVAILKVEGPDGHILYEFGAPEEREVVNPAAAYIITDILWRNGTPWNGLTIDRPSATKTGTSEDFKDALVMGYTPDVVAGVWMGNSDGSPMRPGFFGSVGPGPVWRSFMLAAHEGMSASAFQRPSGLTTVQSCVEGPASSSQPSQSPPASGSPAPPAAPGRKCVSDLAVAGLPRYFQGTTPPEARSRLAELFTPPPTPTPSATPEPTQTPAPSSSPSPTPVATARPRRP